MNSMKVMVVAVAALALTFALVLGARALGPPVGSGAEAFVDRGGPATLEPLWPTPAFRFVDQHGKEVTRESLKGEVWVVNFIFTTCRTVCPLLSTKMVQLQRRLAGVPVRFVSVSVDPAHDTPAVLEAYAAKWAPEEQRWTLLATEPESLQAFAAAMHVTAMKGTTEVDPIIHSSVFLLVDAQGVVRGAFHSEDRADFEALEKGVRTLTGAKGRARALPRDGEGLYHELSCANCHERPELAPPLRGLAGARRELETGLVAVADAAYVRESVLLPQAKRVRGYPLQMPSYEGHVDEKALETLVAWVLERKADPNADAGSDELAVDPVCQMKVRVGAGALRLEVDGGSVFFCSEYCRDRFAEEHPGVTRPVEGADGGSP